MDPPAELISRPVPINQNWGGYSAKVLRRRLSIEKKKGRPGVAPQKVGLPSRTATVVSTTSGLRDTSATAMRAHYGFNMRILASDAKPMDKPAFVDTLREPGWFMEMVPQVDILVSAAPFTKETDGMFNEKVFRSMKKSAYFINISRGGVVDQPALIRALKEGWIAGAGLDVVTPEPLPPESALWDCPNAVLTCHTAGFAPQRRIRQMGLFAENVRRFANGLPLMNVVDKQLGY